MAQNYSCRNLYRLILRNARVDFGAPPGTPIKASGDGAVEFSGRNGAYGNMVRIKHPNGYETLYAHMSRLAENITAGSVVM